MMNANDAGLIGEQQKPYFFLELSGVLCPTRDFAHSTAVWESPEEGAYSDWCGGAGHGYEFHWSPEMLRRLRDLPVRLVFLSDFETDANTVFCPLVGWDPLIVLAQPDGCERWWKAQVVEEFAKSHNSPFVWADPALSAQHWQEQALDAARGASQPYFLLAPERARALTPHDIDVVEEWLSAGMSPNRHYVSNVLTDGVEHENA